MELKTDIAIGLDRNIDSTQGSETLSRQEAQNPIRGQSRYSKARSADREQARSKFRTQTASQAVEKSTDLPFSANLDTALNYI